MVARLGISGVCPQPEATVFGAAKAMGRGSGRTWPRVPWQERKRSAGWRPNEVSRTFLYQQVGGAKEALQEAFTAEQEEEEAGVLFYLPVTRQWLTGSTGSERGGSP